MQDRSQARITLIRIVLEIVPEDPAQSTRKSHAQFEGFVERCKLDVEVIDAGRRVEGDLVKAEEEKDQELRRSLSETDPEGGATRLTWPRDADRRRDQRMRIW